jgi:hypothetical protein
MEVDVPEDAIARVREQLDEAGTYRFNLLVIRTSDMSRILTCLQELQGACKRWEEAYDNDC